jgi:hypothetical protein
MSALFPRWTNTAYGLSLAALAGLPLTGLVGSMIYVRTPWNTGQWEAVDQPVQFDHRHHVIDDGIDCLYCHQGAETSDYAGVPETEVCMGCHAQVWNESPLLEPVRRSYFSGRAIPWNRVHDLPDFVYFSHAVHVQRGIGCVACHGRVDRMARVYENQALTMGFCLGCHERASELTERPLIASRSSGSRSVEFTSAISTSIPSAPGASRSGPARESVAAVANGAGETAEPAVLFGTVAANVEDPLSLGPERHDALTTCTACHR